MVTVRELIEALSKLNADVQVWRYDDSRLVPVSEATSILVHAGAWNHECMVTDPFDCETCSSESVSVPGVAIS